MEKRTWKSSAINASMLLYRQAHGADMGLRRIERRLLFHAVYCVRCGLIVKRDEIMTRQVFPDCSDLRHTFIISTHSILLVSGYPGGGYPPPENLWC